MDTVKRFELDSSQFTACVGSVGGVLDFKQVLSFFFKPRRISGKRRSTFSNSLSLFTGLLILKELLGIFEIMGATSD